MMQTTRLITVAGNVDRETSIAEELSRDHRAELVLRCLERSELLAAVRGARIDLVVFVGVPAWLDAHAVAEATERCSRIVGIASDPLEAEAFRALGVPLSEPGVHIGQLLSTGAEVPITEPVVPRESGRVVAVWGPKGAPGRTTVAVELACEIAKNENRTALIDGDTYGGDIAQMLAVVEEMPTIVWAAQAAAEDRLDEATLVTMLRRAGSQGPVLLPGTNRAELWTDISTYGWARLLDVFSASFSFTVIDVGFGVEMDDRLQFDRDRLSRQTIAAADHVVAICRADPVGIKTFLWSIERLKAITELDEVLVVANRVASGEADEIGYVLKKHLGKRPAVYLPDRPGEARLALDRGIPIGDLKPWGDISVAVRDLAASVGAKVPARGILTRLGGRS